MNIEEYSKKVKAEIAKQTNTDVELKYITMIFEDGNNVEHVIKLGQMDE